MRSAGAMVGSIGFFWPAAVAVLKRRSCFILHLTLLLPAVRASGQLTGSPLVCQKTCLCASTIISCSKQNLTNVPNALPSYAAVLDLSFNFITKLQADWTGIRLDQLQSLLLSNNNLTFLSTEAFVNVRKLRYLDLSFNSLRLLDEYIFEPLENLEVLLLYKNHISQIDRSAFSGLIKLQRLYLSHNQITRILVELLKGRGRLESLRLLDVSSNRIKALPLDELQALPAWIKNGLYFHNNPLTCSCELYELMTHWELRELSPSTDFRSNHTCVTSGQPKEKMAILDLTRQYLNCSEVKGFKKEGYLEQSLVLDCDTRQKNMVKRWVLPGNLTVSQNETTFIRNESSLRIGPLKVEDSGVYTCYATSDSFNETLYVTVVVFNTTMSKGLENLKTAYTTLVACLISLVMILIYLFFTPCRCACCPGQNMEKNDGKDSLHSSTVSLSQAHEERWQERVGGGGFLYRHTAFLEPKEQLEQNGRLNPISEEDEEWQGANRGRTRSDVSSVCSNSPMVI